MKLQMFEAIKISQCAPLLKTKKLPIRTTHGLTKILMAVNPEIEFYQSEFQKIVNQYGLRDDKGELVFNDEQKTSVRIKSGLEQECQTAINELLNLELELAVNVKLKLEDFGDLEISIDELMPLMSFIED